MKIESINNKKHTPALKFKARPMPVMQAYAIDDKLKSSKKVDIICHETSDRDSVNSALVMADYLKKYHIDTRIIIDQNLEALKLRNNNNHNIVQISDLDENTNFETVLCVDFNSRERANPHALDCIDNAKNVVCIDHHVISGSVMNPKSPYFYVDSNAKSASSILYRYFEALDKIDEIDQDMAYEMFYGFCDDALKRGLIRCNGDEGSIYSTLDFTKDKESYEVFLKLANIVGKEDIAEITKNLDILSTLTPKEKEFKQYLQDSLHFSNNGKIAYVELAPDDKLWNELGGDNTRTSAILNRFRQEVLKKYPKVRLALTFYSADDRYRVSAHCNDKRLLNFYKYIEENKIPDFTQNAGGHSNRGGGKIFTLDPNICHKWVSDIISCEEFYA